MTKNDALIELLLHKGTLIKNSNNYRKYVRNLLKELDINDPVEACVLGAVDGMIYDIACALDFTKQKGQISDWSSYEKRRELIHNLL